MGSISIKFVFAYCLIPSKYFGDGFGDLVLARVFSGLLARWEKKSVAWITDLLAWVYLDLRGFELIYVDLCGFTLIRCTLHSVQ